MSEEVTRYDVAVIGGGSGGYAAARTAAAAGMKVVVIDGADELGGLCILRGCMPSKTLIESANRNLALREAGEFGIRVTPGSTVDVQAVIQRKRGLIAEFRDYRAEQLQDGRFTLIRGWARFLDSETLEVTLQNGEACQIKAKSIIVATGSAISVPEISGLEEVGYVTSDEVLDQEYAPASVIVLGGGAIALELAHFYEGIGRDVTVIQRSAHLLSGMDHDIADELEQALTARGMTIYCGTQIQRVERTAAGAKRVIFHKNGEVIQVEAEEILVALGRVPNTNPLNAAAAGVELDGARVVVGNTMQTTAKNIFAVGDVCGPYEIVHIAIEQGEKAAHNALAHLRGESEFQEMDYRLKLYGIFTEPQVASVGITELEAAKQGRHVVVASYPFNDHGKSMVHGCQHGFVKLIGDATTKEILGGAVVGPEATELIHEIVVAMHFRAIASQLAAIPHYHPTLSEIWTYPAEDIADA